MSTRVTFDDDEVIFEEEPKNQEEKEPEVLIRKDQNEEDNFVLKIGKESGKEQNEKDNFVLKIGKESDSVLKIGKEKRNDTESVTEFNPLKIETARDDIVPSFSHSVSQEEDIFFPEEENISFNPFLSTALSSKSKTPVILSENKKVNIQDDPALETEKNMDPLEKQLYGFYEEKESYSPMEREKLPKPVYIPHKPIVYPREETPPQPVYIPPKPIVYPREERIEIPHHFQPRELSPQKRTGLDKIHKIDDGKKEEKQTGLFASNDDSGRSYIGETIRDSFIEIPLEKEINAGNMGNEITLHMNNNIIKIGNWEIVLGLDEHGTYIEQGGNKIYVMKGSIKTHDEGYGDVYMEKKNGDDVGFGKDNKGVYINNKKTHSKIYFGKNKN